MGNEFDNLLQLIRDLWIQFPITKNDLLHPTSSLVVKFYTNFITEFQEKVQFLAGSYYYSSEFNDHLETEDRLFQTMNIIFNDDKLVKFKLSDIYEPVPIRTKNYFYICCHLLSFAATILEEAENLGSNILKMKENTNILENEHEKILSEIHQNATKKSELLETKEKLLQELSKVRQAHEQMKDNMEQKEKLYLNKQKLMEMLKQELQLEEQEIASLENKEKKLSEQSISETEYKNLLNTVENLKNENKSFGNDEINMDDLLVHENDVLLHFQDCRKRLPDVDDFDLEIVKSVIELAEELKDLLLQKEKTIKNERDPLKLVKMQNEDILKGLKQHVEKLFNSFQEIMEQKLKDEEKNNKKINKIKEEMKTDLNYNTGIIKTLTKDIEHLNTQRSDLKNILYLEYTKIATADASAKKYFKRVLSKINGPTT